MAKSRDVKHAEFSVKLHEKSTPKSHDDARDIVAEVFDINPKTVTVNNIDKNGLRSEVNEKGTYGPSDNFREYRIVGTIDT